MAFSPRLIKAGIVIDTGPLLIYAFSNFRSGLLLPKVLSHVSEPEHDKIVRVLSSLLGKAHRVVVTPQVFTEFQVVAQSRARLSSKALGEFLSASLPIFQNVEQYPVAFSDLIEFKSKTDSWHLSFVDSSLLWASRASGLPILTIDGPLVDKCRQLRKSRELRRIRAVHLIETARQV